MAYSPSTSDADFARLMDPIPFAHGNSRTVHNVPSDNNVVVKQSRDLFAGENSLEWHIFVSVRDASNPDLMIRNEKAQTLLPLLGRCLAISPSRRFLLMERLCDLTDEDRKNMPKFPVWLTDKKPSAYGKDAAGHIKVRDYGHSIIGDALADAHRV